MIKYPDKSNIREEEFIFGLLLQRDTVHQDREDVTKWRESMVARTGGWLVTFHLYTENGEEGIRACYDTSVCMPIA